MEENEKTWVDDLKEEIDTNIKPNNGKREITGAKLNATLKDMVDEISENIPQSLGDLESDTTHQTVTENEKENWSSGAAIFTEAQEFSDTQRNQALANVSNQTANSTTGKMGYKVLEPTKTFAEQVTAENTIYEIRDVFEIGDNYTIPNGVALKFNGGKLTGNGVLTFSMTKIEGDANIGCEFAGNIDGVVQIEWFGIKKNDSTFDNGVIINKVCANAKRVSLTVGNVYFSTPIRLEGMSYVEFNCSFAYNGVYGNTSAITFDNSGITTLLYAPTYYIASLSNQAQNTNYRTISEAALKSGDEITILTGITFESVNNCRATVGWIGKFNENVRVSDINAKGNCYNNYHILTSYNANIHVRMYHTSTGWVNGDHFRIQRATNSYSSFSDGDGHYYSCAVAAIGIDDNNSYNNHVFEQCSFEGFDYYCVLARNLGGVLFNGGRGETSSSTFSAVVKAVGSTRFPEFCRFYYNRGELVDTTDATTISYVSSIAVTKIMDITTEKLLKHLHPFNPSNMEATYNFCFDNEIEVGNQDYKGRNVGNAIGLNYSGLTPTVNSNRNFSYKQNQKLAFILDTTFNKYFLISTKKSTAYIRVLYLEDTSGNILTDSSDTQISCGLPLSNKVMSWDSNSFGFSASIGSTQDYDFSLKIPSNVAKVLIGINSSNFSVYAEPSPFGNAFFRDAIKTIGTTSERPSANVSHSSSSFTFNNTTRVYAGFQYYDLDLSKLIIHNGTDWVNLDGTALV